MRLLSIDIYSKIINLGAMARQCFIENCIIMRRFIMRLQCTHYRGSEVRLYNAVSGPIMNV